jgi:hypothetical protein
MVMELLIKMNVVCVERKMFENKHVIRAGNFDPTRQPDTELAGLGLL